MVFEFLSVHALHANSPKRVFQIGRNLDLQSVAHNRFIPHPSRRTFVEPVSVQRIAPSVGQRVELQRVALEVSQTKRAFDRVVFALCCVQLDDAY